MFVDARRRVRMGDLQKRQQDAETPEQKKQLAGNESVTE